jgi:hypothetical protein
MGAPEVKERVGEEENDNDNKKFLSTVCCYLPCNDLDQRLLI